MPLNLALNVVAFNDGPSIEVTDGETTDGTPVDSTVDENTAGVLLGLINASDPDQTLTAANISTSDDRFVIVTDDNGDLWLALADGVSLDHESEPSVEVTVTVTDDEGATAQATVTVTVTDLDEAPTAPEVTPGASDLMVEENGPLGANLALLTSQDPEEEALTFAVANEDFEIEMFGNVALLKLKSDVALDREATQDGTITLTVTASDPAGNTSSATQVVITIVNVNEAPTGEDSVGTVTAGANTAATGDVNANDVDWGDTLSFSIGSATTYGTLTVDEAGAWSYSLDEASEAVVALPEGATLEDSGTIVITDAAGLSSSVQVAITLVGSNDAPSITVTDGETLDGMPAVSTIKENAAGLTLGSVVVSDPDQDLDADNVTTSDPGRFVITTDELGALWLALADGVSLDHETEPMVDVTVTVTDDQGDTATQTVTITVNNLDEAPDAPSVRIFTSNLMVKENDTSGMNLAQLGSQDPEGGDITFKVDNLDFEVEMIEHLALLKVKDGVALDREATVDGTITLMITASDPAGNISDPTEVVVTVLNVNEGPSIGVMDGETADGTPVVSTINEHSTGFVGAVTVSDPEQTLGVDDITLSDDRFSVEADAFGALWLMLNEGVDADTEATVTVELQVIDDDGLTATAQVTINITEINEIPTVAVTYSTTPEGMNVGAVINENETGAIGLITLADPEEELDASDITLSDPRFGTETDEMGGIKLILIEAADYETDGETISVTLTVTDTQGLSSQVVVDLTIVNVNDPPHANQDGVLVITEDATDGDPQEVEARIDLFATAGSGEVRMKLDLGAMFSDQDGDSIFRYHLEDAPGWLTLINVVYGDDGSVSGTLVGTVPAGSYEVHTDVKVVAIDQGGGKGYATFNIIVDDGNDSPTAIHLTNTDGTDNAFFDLEVDEHAQGTVLGHLTVDDQDNPRHPHGQHTWTVDNDAFEIVEMGGNQVLKLKDDAEIDFEEGGTIRLVVTVTDGGMASRSHPIDVEVNNMNDPVVVANEPGNWWVTINDDTVDPETVAKGGYLTFALEVEGTDTAPLFTDQDAADASIPDPSDPTMRLMIGKLTYAIVSGPEWLEIDAETGVITNKAGAEDDELPERGVYEVTVSATDGAGATEMATFKLAVAVSGADDANNDDPDIGSRREIGVPENSAADTVVATFTVTDEDLDLADGDQILHPWAEVRVVIESVMGSPTDGSAAETITGEPLKLVEVSRDSDSISYKVVLTAASAMAINFETYDEITFNVRAYDGVADPDNLTDQNSDLAGFDFEITDVNEAPAVSRDPGGHSSTELGDTSMPAVTVEQSESVDADNATDSTDKITLYINLSKYFDDPDEDDDDDELTYSVSENTPWISITSNVGEWRDVQEGADGEDGTMDDVIWGPVDDPDGRDYVVLLEIDRTGMTNSQDADGSFTITVTDSGGQSTEHTVMVRVMDENLDPAADANGVTLSDDTPFQNDRLTMQFDDSVDPDFNGDEAGEPILELFEWRSDDTPDTTDDDGDLISVSADNPQHLTVTQAHVDDVLKGVAVYFELFEGEIVMSRGGPALEGRTMVVEDRADAATGTITFDSTNASDQLVATVLINDPDNDDGDDANNDFAYTWEYSVNGRGGWVADTADTDNDLMTVVPAAHVGKYVRLVVTFTDDNGTPERVVSTQELEVGAIMTVVAPAITGYGGEGAQAVAVGRTLEVDIADEEGNDLVEWMAGGTVIGTGTEFTVTNAQAGMVIAVRVTTKDQNGKVTSISTTTTGVTVAGSPLGNTQAIVVEDVPVVLLGKAPATDGELQEYRATIDPNTLFDDVEGGLTFSFAGQVVGDDNYADETLDVQLNNAGDQLLVIDETTGEVRYFTTKATEHGDGGTSDGGGNTLDIEVTATEMVGGQEVTTTNTISLAIDVPGEYTGQALTHSVDEHTEMTDATTSETNIQTVDITDLNSADNEYGQYEWIISDDRFSVTADTTDSSMAAVALKAGQTFEIDPDNGEDGELEVTITATPKSGGDAITISLNVTIINQTDDDPATPGDANEVPGLKDNENDSDTDADDETEDDADDGDDDAGTPPAMDATLDDGLF